MSATPVSAAVLRFMSKVDKNGPVVRPALGPCWLWTACTRGAYGQFHFFGRMMKAHRVAYLLFVGDIPYVPGHHGICVCHSCDTPLCVRPAHLALGTQKDNMRDAWLRNRYENRKPSKSAAKLTPDDVRAIRASVAAGTRQAVLARRYRLNSATVSLLVARRTWKEVV